MLSVEPWAVSERAFRLDLFPQTEPIFALSNSHIALRARPRRWRAARCLRGTCERLVEASKDYPCVKRARAEYLGERPEPAINCVE